VLNTNGSGQTQASGWTFAGFSAAIVQAGFAFQAGSPQDTQFAAMLNDLDRIRARYAGKYGDNADTEQEISQHFAPEYSRSMASNQFAISHLPSNMHDVLPVLEDIRADLDIKSKSLSKSANAMGLTGTVFPSIIKIRVTVPSPSAPGVKSSDLSVRANPHYLGTKSPCAYILANGSGSFDGRLPPGRFWVWAEANGVVTAKMEIDVGLSSTDPQLINF
jgi:hypothetical protein